MNVDEAGIRKLVALAEETGLVELEVRSGEQSVRIVRAGVGSAPAGQPAAPASVEQPAGQPVGQPVRAPMAGTFYAAPEPGAEPFLREGQRVSVGDVICIIESMKMMNEIRAEQDGTCMAVHVPNGQPVSAGTTLFHIG